MLMRPVMPHANCGFQQLWWCSAGDYLPCELKEVIHYKLKQLSELMDAVVRSENCCSSSPAVLPVGTCWTERRKCFPRL